MFPVEKYFPYNRKAVQKKSCFFTEKTQELVVWNSATTREEKMTQKPQKMQKKISLFPFSFSRLCVILYGYHYDKCDFRG